jgi:single-strand DNA-binding protein
MSTTVTFAGHLVDDPELGYTREANKPVVSFRVVVNHRCRNEKGEWQEEEPTAHEVRVYGGAATNVADSFGSGNGVTVHGRLRAKAWTDTGTGEKRTKRVVEINDYMGSVGAWVNGAAVRIESTRRSSAPRAV